MPATDIDERRDVAGAHIARVELALERSSFPVGCSGGHS
jgi:hypothetical protein